MTLETKLELFLTMLPFGFFHLSASLPLGTGAGFSKALSAPNAGVFSDSPLLYGCDAVSSLVDSWDVLDSFSLSLILYVARFTFSLPAVLIL